VVRHRSHGRTFSRSDVQTPCAGSRQRGLPADLPQLRGQPQKVERLGIRKGPFDTSWLVEHPKEVVRLVRRLAALALTIGLVAGNAAICAGWMPTPEARMACCADGAECPMHKGDSHRSGSGRVLTQAQADSCCASAEGRRSNQSNPSFVTAITAAVLGVGVVLPANVPAVVSSDAWRTSAPIPIAPVPKHVLLSVFLV
jgi:hypothetical protein